ncbi:MAG: NCS2 family permease [Bacilli bacterium]|nr:NCS2 family permease [Bacilli bacterium]
MARQTKKEVGKFDAFFEITKRKSTKRIEIVAGLTTFLAMAYILIVNPNNILWGGTADPRFSSVFIATALGAFIGTLLMALLAKMPLAQAPGMGLNATVGTIVGGALGIAYSYGNAMALVFVSGIIFLLLSIIPCGRNKDGKLISLREKIFEGVPKAVRTSISVGIGLFIAFIGLQNAHIIVDNQFTLIQLVDFNNKAAWAAGGVARFATVALFGLIVIGVLEHNKVKGSVIWGMLAATLLAIPLGVADTSILAGKVDGISWKFWENIANFFKGGENSVFLALFHGGFNFPKGAAMTSIMLVVSFCMIDMFDTMGTVVGCCKNAKLMDEDDKPINYGQMMYSDSIATVAGSVLGTSTVTTFVESGAGVAAGGKTGLTALTTAILFLLSIFLLPLFAFIPSAAAASALIYVGVLMMKNVVDIDFDNVKQSIPAFVTIITMVLAYSITDGIGMGIISFVVLDLIIWLIDLIRGKKAKLEITWVTLIIFILFLVYFLVPTVI